jgi:hypothetical protein
MDIYVKNFSRDSLKKIYKKRVWRAL